jgi:hypothetical protein
MPNDSERERHLPPLATALSFIDAINCADLERLTRLMSSDHRLVVFTEPPIVGREANTEAWIGYFTSFPRYVLHPARFAAEGSRVAVLGSTTGSHLNQSDAEELQLTLIWIASVVDAHVSVWELVDDTLAHRARLGLV